MPNARTLARQLYRDDLSRADEVPVERDGHQAYDRWVAAASDACDRDTRDDLAAVDRDDFAREWELCIGKPNITTIEATAPGAWASYLINGDASGIDDDERRRADAFVERVWTWNDEYTPHGSRDPVSCDDFGHTHACNAYHWGLCDGMCEAQTYSFLGVRK